MALHIDGTRERSKRRKSVSDNRIGLVEIWKQIHEYPNYEVSTKGNFRRHDNSKPVKTRLHKGMIQVNLYDENGYEHTCNALKLVIKYTGFDLRNNDFRPDLMEN